MVKELILFGLGVAAGVGGVEVYKRRKAIVTGVKAGVKAVKAASKQNKK